MSHGDECYAKLHALSSISHLGNSNIKSLSCWITLDIVDQATFQTELFNMKIYININLEWWITLISSCKKLYIKVEQKQASTAELVLPRQQKQCLRRRFCIIINSASNFALLRYEFSAKKAYFCK